MATLTLGCGGRALPFAPEDPAKARGRMVDEQITARGVTDPRVLAAMRKVPREMFVPPERRAEAYADHPVPIGRGATISQPYIVALMTELAQVQKTDRVLEIGTGSGYQAAVLADLAADVYTIEINTDLARAAQKALYRTGYERVRVRRADGTRGWPEEAPFNAILVTAAAPAPPPALLEQLAPGGRLVMPVGGADTQELEVHRRTARGIDVQRVTPVKFVPLRGEVKGDTEVTPR